MVDTSMLAGTMTTPESRRQLKMRVPNRRIGSLEEISAAVLFVALQEASYVVGALLSIGGGAVLQ